MSYAKPEKKSSSSVGIIILIVVGALLVLMLVCGGILAALLVPAIGEARGAAARMASMNNLKQIGIALHNYHDTYGSFPAAYIEDEDGNPRSSWRTAILPFIEQSPLYDQYDSNRSWDSPENQDVVSQPIDVFHSPRDPNISGNQTSYLALSGPGTVFDGNQFTKIRQISDGTSNTVLVVEVIGSDVPWAKPEDLNIDQVRMSGEPGDLDPEGFLALFADASVRFIEGISLEDLKVLASKSGKEPPVNLDQGANPGF